METVTVRIPASPVYLQVVRLIAAGLATRVEFTLDEIEDLRIAVDEVCAYLTGTQGREGELEIRFEVRDDGIEIKGQGNFGPGLKIRTELTDLSRMILQTVADTATLRQLDGTPTFHVVKTKRQEASASGNSV